jgi:hypothetical protein
MKRFNTMAVEAVEIDNAIAPLDQVDEMMQADYHTDDYDVIALDEEDLWSF